MTRVGKSTQRDRPRAVGAAQRPKRASGKMEREDSSTPKRQRARDSKVKKSIDEDVQEQILCVSAREANAAVKRFLNALDDKVPRWVRTSLCAILTRIAAHVAKSATAAVVEHANGTAALPATLPKRPKSARLQAKAAPGSV